MKKHPVFLTLLLGAIIVLSGVSVAYYNTKTMLLKKIQKYFHMMKTAFLYLILIFIIMI